MWTPTIDGGTFAGAYFTIIGDWASTIDVIKETSIGAELVAIYALIAQIILVNLLIAMMGDTFVSVKGNSDKEWKYSRFSLVMEYISTSFHPPPFNVVVVPVLFVKNLVWGSTETPPPADGHKERENFKKLMIDTRDKLLEDLDEEKKKTLDFVADSMKEQWKAVTEDHESLHKTLHEKLENLETRLKGGSGSNSTEEIDKMEKKLELLQQTLLEAVNHIPSPQVVDEIITVRIQERDVPVTWSKGMKKLDVQNVVTNFKPFHYWIQTINDPQNATELRVLGIHFQGIDMFGASKIGFVKFRVTTLNTQGKSVPCVIFMRGASVGILVILKLDKPDDHTEYTILTVQPRVPVGSSQFAEIPAGMLDEGEFIGVAAKELKEETGIEIKEKDLIDLTALAYNGLAPGVASSAASCDEFLRLFVYRKHVTQEELDTLNNKLTGLIEEDEAITLKVVPLDVMWQVTNDAKALSSLLLYHQLITDGKISKDY